MNDMLKQLLDNAEQLKELNAAIIAQIKVTGKSITHSDYMETAEEVFDSKKIEVPMGSPRFELKKQLWSMFTGGKFK